MNPSKKIGFIGLGQMAQAMIKGLDKENIFASSRNFEKAKATADNLGITAVASNRALTEMCDVIVLAVKPDVIPSVLKELDLTDKLLISVAAGVSLENLSADTSKSQAIIRVMPNVNAAISESTTAIVRNANVTDADYQLTKNRLSQFGSVHELAESDFGVFAALAGSAPAFIYQFIDALAKAAENHGLTASSARQIAAETVAASAHYLAKSARTADELSAQVATPGGSTEAGLKSLAADNFTQTILSALTATIDKEKGLA
ncbi:MAG: pyrroline-5-carboxylate reductase [Streptococcaceae bacterium]|jgi:pyrroline-5-carboxylate reductase|nr:pyrroline-5-carboxylate reductase [Streptococcaceae bacterium]